MKTKRWSYALLLAMLLTSLSCKKDDPAIIICYPQMITDSNGVTTKFNYNDDMTVGSVSATNGGATSTMTFTYDANKHILSAVCSDPGMTLSYDNQGRLIELILSYGAFTTTMMYAYNASGQLSTETISSTDYLQVGTYSYPNSTSHNATGIHYVTTDSGNESSETVTFEYGDKRPAPPVYAGQFAYDNNMTRVASGTTTLITFSYEFNGHGYPTKVTIVTDVLTITQDITYTCK